MPYQLSSMYKDGFIRKSKANPQQQGMFIDYKQSGSFNCYELLYPVCVILHFTIIVIKGQMSASLIGVETCTFSKNVHSISFKASFCLSRPSQEGKGDEVVRSFVFEIIYILHIENRKYCAETENRQNNLTTSYVICNFDAITQLHFKI